MPQSVTCLVPCEDFPARHTQRFVNGYLRQSRRLCCLIVPARRDTGRKSPLFAFLLVLAISMNGLITGCQSKKSTKSKSTAVQGTTYTYHLRGIVRALPRAGQSPRSIEIKTEPIARWVNFNGKIHPMMAMTMPYQLAHGLALRGLAVGDKVAFTYQVNWTADQMVVSSISKLPPRTVLKFSMPTTRQAH